MTIWLSMVKFFRNIIRPTDFTIKPVDLKTAIPLAFCRWHLKRSQILVPLSCCGARKNHRAVRLLDFFDRCHSLASLHRPQGAVGSLPGLEPPVRSPERHKRKEPIPDGMSSFLEIVNTFDTILEEKIFQKYVTFFAFLRLIKGKCLF